MENNNILRSLFFELRANLPRWVLQKLMPQTFFLSWISSLKSNFEGKVFTYRNRSINMNHEWGSLVEGPWVIKTDLRSQ